MDSLSIRLSHHLQRRPIGLRRMVLTFNKSMTKTKHFLKMANLISNINRFLGSESSLDKRLRTDQVNMTKTISTYCLVAISLTLMDTISTRKDTINLVVTMILWREAIFLALNTLTCQCKRTKAITPVTIEAPIRRIDSAALTMECRKTRNFDATMEASMLIRTTKASTVSNTQISSHKRAGGITQIKTTPTGTNPTTSRTSTEGTLHNQLRWYTLRQRIKRWTSAIIMTKCRLVQRTRSSATVTINRTKSHSGPRSIRQTLMINLLRVTDQHQMPRKLLKRKQKKCCWWQSCEMGVGRNKTLDWS